MKLERGRYNNLEFGKGTRPPPASLSDSSTRYGDLYNRKTLRKQPFFYPFPASCTAKVNVLCLFCILTLDSSHLWSKKPISNAGTHCAFFWAVVIKSQHPRTFPIKCIIVVRNGRI